TPLPAVIADISGIIEIIELHKLSCQCMLIGCDGLGKLREIWVSIAGRQIAEQLVIGTVFFDDVDYLLDVFSQCPEYRLLLRGQLQVEAVVLRHLASELVELRRRWNRYGQQSGLG